MLKKILNFTIREFWLLSISIAAVVSNLHPKYEKWFFVYWFLISIMAVFYYSLRINWINKQNTTLLKAIKKVEYQSQLLLSLVHLLVLTLLFIF